MTQPHYLQPARVDDALTALAERRWTILAGGTDFYPARVTQPIREDVLDISRVSELRGIGRDGDGWRLGALTTWSDVVAARLPGVFDGLKQAAREVGGIQIQNAGTLAGNICNASPAADGVPALLALRAQVELASVRGRRIVSLADFIADARRVRREPAELVTALLVPPHAARSRSCFLKLGARRYLVISIVMVAATVELNEADTVARAAVAIGACSPVARRIPALESRLLGQPVDALAECVRAEDFAALAPISDVRGSADYRIDAALQLTRRALAALGHE